MTNKTVKTQTVGKLLTLDRLLQAITTNNTILVTKKKHQEQLLPVGILQGNDFFHQWKVSQAKNQTADKLEEVFRAAVLVNTMSDEQILDYCIQFHVGLKNQINTLDRTSNPSLMW